MRIPPQNLDAEQSALGAMILDSRENLVLPDIVSLLKPDDFYRLDHQIIFTAIVRLYAENQPTDFVTLKAELVRSGKFRDSGDDRGDGVSIDDIVDLAEGVPSAANGLHYARLVKGTSQRRQIISACQKISDDAFDPETETASLLDQTGAKILELCGNASTDTHSLASDVVRPILENLKHGGGGDDAGLATGFRHIDFMTAGGMHPGDLIIVAGRPSMGKSAFALNVLEHVAIAEQKSVAVFSMEMGRDQIVQRLLSSRSGVDSSRIRSGYIAGGGSEDQRLDVACVEFENSDSRIVIDDAATLTPFQLRAKARQYKQKYGIELIVVDYLQLMHVEKSESRLQEVSLISRQLKALARELNIPVIAVSQLNRLAEQREDHRPRLSDLRESGSIEQDADVIMLLFRAGYYQTQSATEDLGNMESNNDAEIIIAKQRHGPTGVVKLVWFGQTMTFQNRMEVGGDFSQ